MYQKANSGRDAFTFSLHGMTTIASFTPAPIVAQDRINKALDERLGGVSRQRTPVIRRLEDFLARYFAPGACRAVHA